MVTRYHTIVADPPWVMRFGGKRTIRDGGRGDWANPKYRYCSEDVAPLAYPTLSVAQLKALPVSDQAEADAHLYLWAPNAYIRDAYDIAEAWGFSPRQLLTWAKTPMGLGLGGAFVPTTEHVLFCRRGKLPAKTRINSTWWNFKRIRPHSTKPPAFMDIVEKVSPGPYLELFARTRRPGWDAWGNEVESDIELALD